MRILLMVMCLVWIGGAVEAKLKKGPWSTDPDLAKVEKEIEKAKKPCEGVGHPMDEMDCYSKVRQKFYSQGLVRGTGEYVDLHYVDLPTPELQAKLKELRALKEQARTQKDAKFDREPGELSEEKILAEIRLVEIELGKREMFKDHENRKFFEKPNTP